MEAVCLFIIACAALPYALPVLVFLLALALGLGAVALGLAFIIGVPHISVPLIIVLGFFLGAKEEEKNESEGTVLPRAA